ncbi:MAG: cobalamin biosynthesis protein CbiG, partial [Clostridium sp.]|nr:cobalamin biosynthesis protein CbiG [Clostridium sp.]
MENKGKEEKPIVIFSFTEEGCRLNRKLNALLAKAGYKCGSYTTERFAAGFGMKTMDQDLKQWIGERWGRCSFLFIGAAGIAIRYIAPWVADKYRDSAVLSMDEKGGFVIPLLSGHVGGAVRLAMLIAEQTGAVPVVTTATDVQNKFAVDVFAKENHLHIGSRRLAKEISAAVLEGKKIGFYSAYPVE